MAEDLKIAGNFTRVKYRPPALISVPESQSIAYESIGALKKSKPVQSKVEIKKNKLLEYQSVVYFPGFTQKRIVSEIVESNEEEYFKEIGKNTIFDRLKAHKILSEKQQREYAMKVQAAKVKRQFQKQLRQAKQNIQDKITDYEMNGETEDEDGVDLAELLRTAESFESETEEDVKFKQHLMELKEKKLLMDTPTQAFHTALTKWEATKLALSFAFGLVQRTNRLYHYSEVFPWLLLGPGDLAQNQQLLRDLRITHILNMTPNFPNRFPESFVYLQIPIWDALDTDLSPHLLPAANFIRRAEKMKGRIYVHCVSGVSRAPSVVLAYLVKMRRITLLVRGKEKRGGEGREDAYTFLRACRPAVRPNSHFLTQLAELEATQGFGCSVTAHEEWRCYEFNQRLKKAQFRTSKGLYSTVKTLHDPRKQKHLVTA